MPIHPQTITVLALAARPGASINYAAVEAFVRVTNEQQEYHLLFNGHAIRVRPTDTPENIVDRYAELTRGF